MKCKAVNSKFLSYLDGEVDLEVKKEIEEHISSCEDCSKLLTLTKEIYQHIDKEKEEYIPNEYLAVKVWDRISAKKEKLAPVFSLQRSTIAYLAVASVFLGILIGTIFSRTIFSNETVNGEQTWSQLADEYFPTEYYEPLEDINENSK